MNTANTQVFYYDSYLGTAGILLSATSRACVETLFSLRKMGEDIIGMRDDPSFPVFYERGIGVVYGVRAKYLGIYKDGRCLPLTAEAIIRGKQIRVEVKAGRGIENPPGIPIY